MNDSRMNDPTPNRSRFSVIVALMIALSATPCSFGEEAVGDLRISQSPQRVLTTLTVGGSDPVPVVFDTGTSGNIIDRKLAAKLALPDLGPSTAIDGSLGKPVPGFLTEIKRASLGHVAIEDGQANAIDYDLATEKGVFGPNSFPGKLVQMDLGNGSIRIEPKTTASIPQAPAMPYIGQGDDALPAVMVDFGSIKVAAELDTGNNEALLFPLSLAKRLPLEDQLKEVGEAGSAAGRQPLFRARLKGVVRIGPLTIKRPNILFIAGGQPNVGLPIARQLVVVFDPSEKRSWLIAATSPSMSKSIVGAAVALMTLGSLMAALFFRRSPAR